MVARGWPAVVAKDPKMTPRTSRGPRAQKSRISSSEGPNLVLIAGGALLSTLSIRLGFKLKQAFDTRQLKDSDSSLTGNAKSSDRRKAAGCRCSNVYSFPRDDERCFNCMPGTQYTTDVKCPPTDQMVVASESALPLVMVPASGFNKENSIIWASSPDQLELPAKQFHHSNCSDSPCVSDSGSDIFSKREVIHKLRHQLKRRDDMILEMQDQIVHLQNSLNAQAAHSSHLQSQLDAANQDLFDSEREIQKLRKAIADHCLGQMGPNDKSPSTVRSWSSETRNGHANGGYMDVNCNFEVPEKVRDGERIEMLKKEVGDLKDVIEGKEYLLQSYKEQKTELSLKIKELQQRLDSQLPNIL
ncbi:uncharacterized protein LOC120078072 isoform X2 [Benincasa hispida]|uniref:uncharacterized protein LOC120078072 isoform X2 n=1 Tax=Benincasa hispida TaxID=102211 RepID=UPI00190190CA|nr:uncharacterized protein LOC120078072 isoform X2 [Benincasa hispida]